VEFTDDDEPGLLTLHLDGLHDRAGPRSRVLVRQNPWSAFDPEGLWQKEAGTLAALTAEYAASAASGATGAVLGTVALVAAPVAVFGMTAYVCVNPPDSGPGVPNTTPGAFDCNSGRSVTASQTIERGLIMPQHTQADQDAYSHFLATGDRRELDDYLAERSTNAKNPGGPTAQDIAEANQKKVPNPDGSKGKADHQKSVNDLVKQKQAEHPDADEIRSNQSIEDLTGLKRRPDVAVVKNGQVVEVGEVARTNKNGSIVSREQKKQDEYRAAGIPSTVKQLPPSQH
jgi:hypothetical protein